MEPYEQPQTTPPSEQPEPTRHGLFHNKLFGYGFLAIILVLVAGGVYAWQYGGNNNPPPTPPPPANPVTSDPTADWQKYFKENETFGIKYQVNYPEDWSLIASSTDNLFSIGNNGAMLNIETPPLGFGVDLSQAEDVVIDGNNATKVNYNAGSNKQGIVIQFVDKSLENIQIVFTYPSGYNSQIFDQILSTFKFIESSPTPSSTSNPIPESISPAVSDEEYKYLSDTQKIVKDALARSTRRQVKVAAELYYDEKGYFPTSMAELLVYPDSTDPYVSEDFGGVDLLEYVYTNSNTAEVCIIEKYFLPGRGTSQCEPIDILY